MSNAEPTIILLDDELQQELLEITNGGAAPCFQCGVCTAVCPWGVIRGEPFSVRKLIRDAQLGIDQGLEDLWLCTTCGHCELYCPRGVPVAEVIRGLRHLLWKRQAVPHGLSTVLWSLYWNNNPQSQPPSERMKWSEGLDLEEFDADRHEVLMYLGCSVAYDRRAQHIAIAAISVLRAAKVRFGVIGEDEPCCGETALSFGYFPFYEELAEKAESEIIDRGAAEVVSISPHCWEALNRRFEKGKSKIRPIHISRYLSDLVQQGRLDLKQPVSARVAYQDPCMLGRSQETGESVREILQQIPEIELRELEHHGPDAMCCGGGGGRMWMETEIGERFADLRIQEAENVGAELIVTACPDCLSCLEDSAKGMDDATIRVLDLVELIDLSVRSNERSAS